MDTYMEVKGKIGNAETLISQSYEIIRRRREREKGDRVSLMYLHLLRFADRDFRANPEIF